MGRWGRSNGWGRWAALAGAATTVLLLGTPAAGASSAAATLYHQAMATTKAWSVHYASASDISQVPILETGDAGPASGTQEVVIGSGTTTDIASLIVIGDLTYLKGNVHALEDMVGLTPTQATTLTQQWVVFSSSNSAFAAVVAGVRSHDVAQEVAMQGPYTLGPSRVVDGVRADAIYGTLKLQGLKRMRMVLYVRAAGRHLLVEEDAVGATGKPDGMEHIVFSRWGESVKPRAPNASVSLGSISTT
jgi:hypothetical protein